MALTIEDEFLKDAKRHMRIMHSADDNLIKTEIMVATNNIYKTLLLVEDADMPQSTNDFTENVRLAVMHLTATYRQNPDERIESRFIPQTKRLIERILGSERKYNKVV